MAIMCARDRRPDMRGGIDPYAEMVAHVEPLLPEMEYGNYDDGELSREVRCDRPRSTHPARENSPGAQPYRPPSAAPSFAANRSSSSPRSGKAGRPARSWRCHSPLHRRPLPRPSGPCAPDHPVPRPSAWHARAQAHVPRRHGRGRDCARPGPPRRTSSRCAASGRALAAEAGWRGGPIQTCAASRMPSAGRLPGNRPSQSGCRSSHRATASTNVIWKLKAGL